MKIDENMAENILNKVKTSAQKQNDKIGSAIDKILRGSHKTYRYVLVTALLAKSTDNKADMLSLQAGDSSDGAYDARSLCHHVIVPFERKYYPNSIGGSNEPYLNKPARFQRLTLDNAVRRGNDRDTLELLISILTEIKNQKAAQKYLSSAIFTMQKLFEENEDKYSLPDLEIPDNEGPQAILNFINDLADSSFEGEMCPLIVASVEQLYYEDSRNVVAHNVNESGASSKEVGDIDIFDINDNLLSSIEVKDKDFTQEDVEHAINKFASAKLERNMFIYGKKASFDAKKVYQTAARLGRAGFFCSIVSIMDFVRMRLYSIQGRLTIQNFTTKMLDNAKMINAKDETVEWIKNAAIEYAL